MALLQDKLLFTKADIAKAREISANITDAKIEPYIRETQSLSVRTFLGDQLYLLLLNDYTVSSNHLDHNALQTYGSVLTILIVME